MTTFEIGEARVTFGDGVKKEEYGAVRKAEVSFTIIVPPGADGATLIDMGFALAVSKVREVLGQAAVIPGPVNTASPALPKETPAADPSAVSETPAEAPKRTRRTAAQIAADEAAKTNPAADPSAVVDDPSAVADDLTTAPATAVSDPSAIDDLTTAPATAEITDGALNDAVQARNAALKQPTLIRNLIGTFNPDPTKPFQLASIPQAQRQDFLDKLAALTAPA